MTLLFHTDESRDSKYHFQVGLISRGATVAVVEQELDRIVRTAFENGACTWPAEIHGSELFNERRKGPWAAASIEWRIWVFDSALDLLEQHEVEVLVRGANRARFEARYGTGSDPHEYTFSNLLERFNERLTDRGAYGLVIADEAAQHNEAIRKDLVKGKRSGTGGYRSQKLDRIVDTAHFVDSKASRMVQLADLTAYVCRRRATRPEEHDPRLEEMMDRWHSKIAGAVPEPQGQYYTIRWDSS